MKNETLNHKGREVANTAFFVGAITGAYLGYVATEGDLTSTLMGGAGFGFLLLGIFYPTAIRASRKYDNRHGNIK